VRLWKSASIPLESPPGEAEALRSLTAWERVVFAGLVKRMEWAAANVEKTKRNVARFGFVSVVHLAVAQQLQTFAAAAFLGGIAISSAGWVVGTNALWPFAAFAYVLGGALFCWHVFRLVTLRRARQVFVACGRSQEPLAEFASAPSWAGAAPWGLVVSSLDMFAIGVIFFNAAYSAPRVTGAFFLVLAWLLVLFWVQLVWGGLTSRRAGEPVAARATGGPSKRPGATNSVLTATAVYAVVFLSVQSTLGHGLARDAASLATTTTASPAATAATVPAPAGSGPQLNGDPDEYICETLVEDSLAGVAQGESLSEVVSAFETLAEGTMSNPSVAFSWFQSEEGKYDRQIKAVGRAQAKVEMETAVLGRCPLLISEGFTPHT
jgi:hypothetical protein